MRRLVFPLALALALPARATPSTPAPIAAPAKPTTFRFAWPVPARVTVTERVLKKGKRVTEQYDVVLSRAAGAQNIEVRLEKFSFLEFDGTKIGPDAPPQLQELLAIASALPTLVISPEGRLVDAIGFEEMIDRVVALTPDEKRREAMRALLHQPSMVAMLKQKCFEFWGLWVSTWSGLELTEGEPFEGTSLLPLPNGQQLEATVTVRHQGPDARHPGAVRLQSETVLDGEAFRLAMAASVAHIAAAAPVQGKAQPDFSKMLTSARKATTLDVVTEPGSLRTHWARSVQRTRIEMGGEAREEREEHEYDFAWPAAEKAKAAK